MWLCESVLESGTASSLTMVRGALELQFFSELLKGLSLRAADLPGPREDRTTWPYLFDLFTKIFKSKNRREWETIFDGTDACVTPVLTQSELEQSNYVQRPIVTLKSSGALAIARNDGSGQQALHLQDSGVDGEGWTGQGMFPGQGGEKVLEQWLGWRRGRDYNVAVGGLIKLQPPKL